MTKEEGIRLLRVYRKNECRNPTYTVLCRRHLVDEVLRDIRVTGADPIAAVERYYSLFDRVLAESDSSHTLTHRFAGTMEEEAGELMRYLKTMEKEKMKDAAYQHAQGRKRPAAGPETEGPGNPDRRRDHRHDHHDSAGREGHA